MSSCNIKGNVAEFYAGKSVFITGGTGFLGKVIVEKLLYSCPKIDKIYALIRKKKTENPEERLQNMLDLPIFSRLKKERPADVAKIIPVVGDITKPDLGINEKDQKILTEKVNVVFHIAATVKFNETLRVSMKINFDGTRNTLNLSRKMKKLQAFVYVSTAYTNPDREEIEEIIYPPPASYKDIYSTLEKYGNDLKKINVILNGHPNTYTFTKALAENYVAENHGCIPTIIVRPSIVMGSKNEPIEGWVDNWFGANGTLTMVGRGHIRVLCGKGSNILDLIPVDYVSNLIIAGAAKCKGSTKLQVYNICSGFLKPVTLETICRCFIEENVRLKLNDVPYPTVTFTTQPWLISIITFLAQIIPAFIMDCMFFITGKKSRYMNLQAKIKRMHYSQRYFTSNSRVFRSEQAKALYASLSASDKSNFQCDPSDIIWPQYLAVCCNGINRYLLWE